MASVRMFKKSEMNRPLPTAPSVSADPGEFGLVDNEDGTLTLAILDPTGQPFPIDPDSASMTVESDALDIMEVELVGGFSLKECVVGSTAPIPQPSRRPTKDRVPDLQHPPATTHRAPGSGAVAGITVTVTWAGEGRVPHRLTWKDTVTGAKTFTRSLATVE